MIIDSVLYVEGKKVEAGDDYLILLKHAQEMKGFVWIGLADPTQEEFDHVAKCLQFHPLAVEDSLTALQHPKIEEYEGQHFLVAKTVFFKEALNDVYTGELIFFVGEHYVVIVRHGEGTPLKMVRHDLEVHPNRLREGPWAVVHAVLDRVIDEYTKIALQFDKAIQNLEAKVFGDSRSTYSQEIYFLKREVIEYRHAVEPLVFPVQKLALETVQNTPKNLLPFFRDLDDHLKRACDSAAGLDSLLTTVLQADLAHVQLRQNDDMRRISAWVGLAAVPTMVAGIYGMNFENMPELKWKYGYFILLGSVALFSSILFTVFKKSKWL